MQDDLYLSSVSDSSAGLKQMRFDMVKSVDLSMFLKCQVPSVLGPCGHSLALNRTLTIPASQQVSCICDIDCQFKLAADCQTGH